MVDLYPVTKWWSENRTEKSLFMIQNVQYLKVPPSHMTLPFKYWTPKLSGIQMNPVFRCLVFRWLLYSDPHCIGLGYLQDCPSSSKCCINSQIFGCVIVAGIDSVQISPTTKQEVHVAYMAFTGGPGGGGG